jgi:hypothetical protein
MQVHTSKPSQFMAEVERNLITPMTTSTSINSSIPSLIGGGASAPSQQANLITPLAAAPSSTANAFGLLSAFYNAGTSFLPNTSPIAPTPSMPDVSAFKEVSWSFFLIYSYILVDNESAISIQSMFLTQGPQQSTDSANSVFLSDKHFEWTIVIGYGSNSI